jgi:hypothetical protein
MSARFMDGTEVLAGSSRPRVAARGVGRASSPESMPPAAGSMRICSRKKTGSRHHGCGAARQTFFPSAENGSAGRDGRVGGWHGARRLP